MSQGDAHHAGPSELEEICQTVRFIQFLLPLKNVFSAIVVNVAYIEGGNAPFNKNKLERPIRALQDTLVRCAACWLLWCVLFPFSPCRPHQRLVLTSLLASVLQIVQSEGPSGPNIEYALLLADTLHKQVDPGDWLIWFWFEFLSITYRLLILPTYLLLCSILICYIDNHVNNHIAGGNRTRAVYFPGRMLARYSTNAVWPNATSNLSVSTSDIMSTDSYRRQ